MKITAHKYGMRLRGFSPGCQPMDGFVDVRPSKIYHDVLYYNRLLTDKERETYELDYLGTEEWKV